MSKPHKTTPQEVAVYGTGLVIKGAASVAANVARTARKVRKKRSS